jgi:hypothetical protein
MAVLVLLKYIMALRAYYGSIHIFALTLLQKGYPVGIKNGKLQVAAKRRNTSKQIALCIVPCMERLPVRKVLEAFAPEVKRLTHKAVNLPASSAEIKNAWGQASTPSYIFMEWYLVKHREKFMDSVPYRTVYDLSGVRIRAGNSSLHRCVQTGSGAHPASYPMGIRGSFPGDRAASA